MVGAFVAFFSSDFGSWAQQWTAPRIRYLVKFQPQPKCPTYHFDRVQDTIFTNVINFFFCFVDFNYRVLHLIDLRAGPTLAGGDNNIRLVSIYAYYVFLVSIFSGSICINVPTN